VRAAEGLARQADMLPRFTVLSFPGYTLTGEDIRAQLETATVTPLTLKPFQWLPLQLLQPVWPMARSLVEMRYLWDTPHTLDGSAFAAQMPDFVPSPETDAARAAIGAA